MNNSSSFKTSIFPNYLNMKHLLRCAFLIAAAFLVCIMTSCGVSENSEESNAAVQTDRFEDAAVITNGESLVIPAADITDTASFYAVEADGIQMEVLVVRDSSGEIRTAFNTCQVCYGSDKAYYEQSGRQLVCQNCGNQFSMDQVGVEAGGCNPWPILDDAVTITDDSVSISYDYLSASGKEFADWAK